MLECLESKCCKVRFAEKHLHEPDIFTHLLFHFDYTSVLSLNEENSWFNPYCLPSVCEKDVIIIRTLNVIALSYTFGCLGYSHFFLEDCLHL